MLLQLVLASLAIFSFTYANQFFVTHPSYVASTLNTVRLSSVKTAGDYPTVMQQCRRNCAHNLLCQAFHLTFLHIAPAIGVFRCDTFAQNTCNWSSVALKTYVITAIDKLWEKLSGAIFKPKPCAEQCVVKLRGNCTACRGYSDLQGLNCEIAPRICSDYPKPLQSSRGMRPVWPWGIDGPIYNVTCAGFATEIAYSLLLNNSVRQLSFLGWPKTLTADNWQNYSALFANIDWPLISRMQRFSTQKILKITMGYGYNRAFGGLEISPRGELSLNSSLDDPVSPGIPLPVIQAPFLEGKNNFCGNFWQFRTNISVCSQQTNLFNYLSIKWNGSFTGSFVSLIFL